MRLLVYALPLLFALVLNLGAAVAQTGLPDNPSAAPEWAGIFVSYGLAGVMILWWIAKGYPAWLAQWSADLTKQREEFHSWRREIADDIRGMRSNLDTRPCLLTNDSIISRLLALADKERDAK